MSQLSAVGLNN